MSEPRDPREQLLGEVTAAAMATITAEATAGALGNSVLETRLARIARELESLLPLACKPLSDEVARDLDADELARQR